MFISTTSACLLLPLIQQLYSQAQEEINLAEGPGRDDFARGSLYPQES